MDHVAVVDETGKPVSGGSSTSLISKRSKKENASRPKITERSQRRSDRRKRRSGVSIDTSKPLCYRRAPRATFTSGDKRVLDLVDRNFSPFF